MVNVAFLNEPPPTAAGDPLRDFLEETTAIVWLDAAGTVRHSSPAALQVFGVRDPVEVAGRTVWEFLDPAETRRARRWFAKLCHEPGARFSGEWRARTAAGEPRYLEVSGCNLLGVAGVEAVVLIAHDVSAHLALEAELSRSRDELQGLSAHRETVREEEQTRIARVVHDELGQELTAHRRALEELAQRLKNTGRIGDAGSVEELQLQIDALLERVRSVAAELRPAVLDQLGLGAAIEWQAREWERRYGISCGVTLAVDDNAVVEPVRTAMYRILQEALTNVARHAAATRVEVRLGRDPADGRLRLEVADNGCGLVASAPGKPLSLGMLGMRERALLMGGEIHFEGMPSKGTVVTVWGPAESRKH